MNLPGVLDTDLRLVSERARQWRDAPGDQSDPRTSEALGLLRAALRCALATSALCDPRWDAVTGRWETRTREVAP